ncbi:MAG: wax ester/triacylglycerol synthase family O-acyltransferase [Acidimicrobiia bacterium]|nr:wax ester/triacylglycerol synthase family O-acyltransferase [Acidimicrobiia bacterium]MBT8250647.1 wax ester/triacylglycerol synthase family O-acyltransferase [Acidimicrobiia bacterium]NNC42203.1 wax ester/triacylglycerol synthase family O-acyltransferase [Acidimicrobiia bacterium]NND14219.1 wax ester/triacylglycerol synthase family O-acyltransferase [Acidimicrobiia bacterium]NNL28811.1 wax ester/triacylglycerol synthase family O-acyltransferase [Acidimicrobiia bacterium]
MTDIFYERLSFLDSTYLAMEDRNAHFHVAGVMIFEGGSLVDGKSVNVGLIRDFIDSKLHLIPRYREVIMTVPFDGHPVWVDDEHFDINYHVRHTSLPHPGTHEQLQEVAARIFSQKLDRFRPLWEVWVVEGLEDDKFAIIAKVHHCMIDGMAGVDLLKVLLNFWPSTDIEDPPPFEPRPAPTKAALLSDEVSRRVRQPMDLVKGAAGFLRGGDAGEALSHRARAMSKALGSGWLQNADETPINPHIGPNRRFHWTTTPLEDVKDVKNRLGGTVNDVILATVAGAVRTFLQQRGTETDDLEFRIMAPVSVRSEDDTSMTGNNVAMWLLDLPIDVEKPVDRFKAVGERTAELKDTDQALGASLLVQAGSWTPTTILSLAARLAATNIRPFNMTVTNVPGPQIPIYMLDAKLEVHYPMVPLWSTHGLGVALFSYEGQLAWGIVSDADSVPDAPDFVAAIESSFKKLHTAAKRRKKKVLAS